jgi:hypothetical protein
MVRRVALLFVLSVGIASALAQDTHRPATPLPPELASMFGYGDSNKSCLAWTDGCGTCSRADNGDPLCPNIGIACQPTPIRCVRSAEQPNPPAPEEKKSEPPK